MKEGQQYPGSWSSDGEILAFSESSQRGLDIWMLAMEGGRDPVRFLATSSDEAAPRFSPDGRWLAYISNESGRYEVYVQSYPGPGGRWTISTQGGTEPVWSADGRELFYRHGSQMMVVDISTAPTFAPGTPRRLFEGYELNPYGLPNYDVSPDGKRFLMVQSDSGAAPTQLNVVLNWTEEVQRLVRRDN